MSGRRFSIRYGFFASIAVFIALSAGVASAHPEGFSGLRVRLESTGVQAELTLHTRDLSAWFPPGKYPDYVADVCRALARVEDLPVEISYDDVKARPARLHADSPEVGMVRLVIEYPPAASGPCRVWFRRFKLLPVGHQQILQVEDHRGTGAGGRSARILADPTLSRETDSADFEIPPLPAVTGAVSNSTPASLPGATTQKVADAFEAGRRGAHICMAVAGLIVLTIVVIGLARRRKS